jgi:AcrR family transcriptional regulator
VTSKDELIDLVVEQLIGAWIEDAVAVSPLPADLPWGEALRRFASGLRQLLLEHPRCLRLTSAGQSQRPAPAW